MARLPTKLTFYFLPLTSRKGQSLIELMIAVAIGAILIGSAAVLITVTLKASAQNKFMQAASFLSQDLIENVTVFARYEWYCPSTCSANYGIYNLTKGPTAHYHLDSGTTPFEWVLGDEPTITLDGVPYTRYFYLENVSRDAVSGDIVASGGIEDPSTQKIVAVTSWPNAGEVKIEKYLTRNRNQVVFQTDWGGGATTPTLETVSLNSQTNKFYSEDDIDFTSLPGSIQIQSP